jgi:DNA-binding transcriptional LysR family regulator
VKCIVYIILMRELNINGIDLNLLPPLAALLEHRNVTRAAAVAGMSQPAMSRALGRLRTLLGDELLARGSSGYVLTPRAAALRPLLQATLDGVTALLTPAVFDPATARRTIRIAGSDSHSVGIVPAVMARLAREAPGIDLRLEAYSRDLPARIESGAVDMAFAIASSPLPPGALSMPLADDRLALVMRRGHPAADRDWTIADYGRWQHAGVAILGDGQSDIDAALAAAGVRRRIALVTPHFTAALAAVAATDLVTTVSERFARRFEKALDLVVKPPPLGAIDLQLTVVWSHIRDADPVLGWFREVLAEVASAADL